MQVSKRTVGYVALAAGLFLGGGLAYSAIPGADGVIHTCVDNTNGAVRVIDTEQGGVCRGGESALNWNERGPQGAVGPQGPAGQPALALPPEIGLIKRLGGMKVTTTTKVVKHSTPASQAPSRIVPAKCPSSHPKLVDGSYDVSGATPNPQYNTYVDQFAWGHTWWIKAFIVSSTPWKLTAIAYCKKP